MNLLPKLDNCLSLTALFLLVGALGSGTVFAEVYEVMDSGRVEYEHNCAVCHGETGKGDGRMAEILISKPTDLTEISKRNDGVFPFWEVYATLSGENPVIAHGNLQMPVWGKRFRNEEGHYDVPAAYLRILVLTHYLESIQAK